MIQALMSPLAKRVLKAGIRITPGVPFQFEGKTYTPLAGGQDGEPLCSPGTVWPTTKITWLNHPDER